MLHFFTQSASITRSATRSFYESFTISFFMIINCKLSLKSDVSCMRFSDVCVIELLIWARLLNASGSRAGLGELR